jgi:hypothetical protein
MRRRTRRRQHLDAVTGPHRATMQAGAARARRELELSLQSFCYRET